MYIVMSARHISTTFFFFFVNFQCKRIHHRDLNYLNSIEKSRQSSRKLVHTGMTISLYCTQGLGPVCNKLRQSLGHV